VVSINRNFYCNLKMDCFGVTCGPFSAGLVNMGFDISAWNSYDSRVTGVDNLATIA